MPDELQGNIVTVDDLPPIGAVDGTPEAAAVVSRMCQLAMQTQPFSESWVRMARDNLMIFAYGNREVPKKNEFIANRIQGNIISNITGEPPRPSLECGGSQYPTEYWWVGPDYIGIQLGIEEGAITQIIDPFTGQMIDVAPLSATQGQQLMQSAVSGVPFMGAPGPQGMPAPIQIEEDWIVQIDADSVQQFYQTLLDKKWDESGVHLDDEINDAKLWTAIYGWILWHLDYDNDLKRPIIRQLPITQAYLDIQPRIEKMQWAEIDLIMTTYEAISLRPDLADEINEFALRGTTPPTVDQNTQWGQTEFRTHYDPIVPMRICWMRNQWAPMDVDEAIKGGKVEQRMVPGESAGLQPSGGPGGGDVGDNTGADAGGDGTGGTRAGGIPANGSAGGNISNGETDGDQGSGTLAADQDTGVDDGSPNDSGSNVPSESNPEPEQESPTDQSDSAGEFPQSGQSPVPAIPQRSGLFLPGTDTEVAPLIASEDGTTKPHPQWPHKRVIRESVAIMSHLVSDRICPWPEFPLLHNTNIQSPGRPWGFGEPYRQYSAQHADNKTLDAMVKNGENYGKVQENIPQSVNNALTPKQKEEGFGGRRIWPDDMYQRLNGKPSTIVEPPPLPAALPVLHNTLQDIQDKISGHPEVLQGNVPAGVTANVAIQSLQGQASKLNEWKLNGLNGMVRQMATLLHHANTWFMEPADIAEFVGDYPLHVIVRFVAWGRNLKWTVRVDPAGHQHQTDQQRSQVMGEYQAGLRSKESTQEALKIDPRLERTRQHAEQQAMQMAMPQPMPGAARPVPVGR